jgi:hypothetical protein
MDININAVYISVLEKKLGELTMKNLELETKLIVVEGELIRIMGEQSDPPTE